MSLALKYLLLLLQHTTQEIHLHIEASSTHSRDCRRSRTRTSYKPSKPPLLNLYPALAGQQ